MDLDLVGRRAIVTGSSRGIGFAVAAALLREGANVALAARDPQGLAEALSRLDAPDGRALAVPLDTTDDASVRALVARTVEVWGGVDVLVNAAATPLDPDASPGLAGFSEEALRLEVETKVLGYVRTARAAAPVMAAAGWGRIINVSGLAARSTGSTIGSIRNVAVSAMTKNLADELGPRGINVTAVHPGTTETERMPDLVARMAADRGTSEVDVRAALARGTSIGRLVTAAEVADVVAFLASPRSVAITGDTIPVGGGVPGAIYY